MDPICDHRPERKASTRRRTGAKPVTFPVVLKSALAMAIFYTLLMAGMIPHIAASSSRPGNAAPGGSASPRVRVAAGDTCATATVINPAALPFFDEGTNAGAANDIDAGAGGCAPGPGADVVYSFTPTATDSYTVGATPLGASFDLSLYIITD